jgi:DNA recombination protein RmuC
MLDSPTFLLAAIALLALASIALALWQSAAAARANERLERELRAAVEQAASQVRIETGARLAQLEAALAAQVTQTTGVHTQQLTAYGQTMREQLEAQTRALQAALAEVRSTLHTQLDVLRAENAAKLEQVRATVDDKLQATLEARLGESFRLVSERLEQVHRGLGEMQTLAAGVGDLKRVLVNVKTRGLFGEVQLAALLEQVLAPEQYAKNVKTRPGANEPVEFAIRMPGKEEGASVWLPIDAKFPTEDYERLLAAQDAADREAVEAAARALENRIRMEARRIRDKYVEPPHTTDFAILFLPAEGLFAEVLRRPGLTEALNRELRIVIAGPTTLFAMLNSLQMGFRTLALERRSAEVWQVLGAVKSEFARFGEVLARVKSQLATAANTIEQAETRTRQMQRKLRDVEALPQPRGGALFAEPGEDENLP